MAVAVLWYSDSNSKQRCHVVCRYLPCVHTFVYFTVCRERRSLEANVGPVRCNILRAKWGNALTMLVRHVDRRVMGVGDASNRPTHGPKDSVDDRVNRISCTLIYWGEPSLFTFFQFNLVLFPGTFVLRSFYFLLSSRLNLLLGQLKATYSLVLCFCELMLMSLSVYFWPPVLYAVRVVV